MFDMPNLLWVDLYLLYFFHAVVCILLQASQKRLDKKKKHSDKKKTRGKIGKGDW